jgi:hypothetical protein
MQLNPSHVFGLLVMVFAPQGNPEVTLMRCDPLATAPEGQNLGT